MNKHIRNLSFLKLLSGVLLLSVSSLARAELTTVEAGLVQKLMNYPPGYSTKDYDNHYEFIQNEKGWDDHSVVEAVQKKLIDRSKRGEKTLPPIIERVARTEQGPEFLRLLILMSRSIRYEGPRDSGARTAPEYGALRLLSSLPVDVVIDTYTIFFNTRSGDVEPYVYAAIADNLRESGAQAPLDKLVDLLARSEVSKDRAPSHWELTAGKKVEILNTIGGREGARGLLLAGMRNASIERGLIKVAPPNSWTWDELEKIAEVLEEAKQKFMAAEDFRKAGAAHSSLDTVLRLMMEKTDRPLTLEQVKWVYARQSAYPADTPANWYALNLIRNKMIDTSTPAKEIEVFLFERLLANDPWSGEVVDLLVDLPMSEAGWERLEKAMTQPQLPSRTKARILGAFLDVPTPQNQAFVKEFVSDRVVLVDENGDKVRSIVERISNTPREPEMNPDTIKLARSIFEKTLLSDPDLARLALPRVHELITRGSKSRLEGAMTRGDGPSVIEVTYVDGSLGKVTADFRPLDQRQDKAAAGIAVSPGEVGEIVQRTLALEKAAMAIARAKSDGDLLSLTIYAVEVFAAARESGLEGATDAREVLGRVLSSVSDPSRREALVSLKGTLITPYVASDPFLGRSRDFQLDHIEWLEAVDLIRIACDSNEARSVVEEALHQLETPASKGLLKDADLAPLHALMSRMKIAEWKLAERVAELGRTALAANATRHPGYAKAYKGFATRESGEEKQAGSDPSTRGRKKPGGREGPPETKKPRSK